MNADFFKCAMCTMLIEVQNSKQAVLVAFDKANQGWRIICPACAARLKARGVPYAEMSYDMLKEKAGQYARN